MLLAANVPIYNAAFAGFTLFTPWILNSQYCLVQFIDRENIDRFDLASNSSKFLNQARAGCGLSNEAHHEFLPKKTKATLY